MQEETLSALDTLSARNMADILHLAVNISGHQNAAKQILAHVLAPSMSAAHQVLQDQMTPQLLQELYKQQWNEAMLRSCSSSVSFLQ